MMNWFTGVGLKNPVCRHAGAGSGVALDNGQKLSEVAEVCVPSV